MDGFSDLIVCPACQGRLAPDWSCPACLHAHPAADGVPDLRVGGSPTTETVRRFYERAPFPGYRPRETLATLRARAERSDFARRLDAAISGDASVVEVGCGTGQMCLHLAKAERRIVGADVARASLGLGAAAARRFGMERLQFVQTDLHRPALRFGGFDVVYSSGVLHHTADPRAAFAAIARLAKPGGLIVLGLYNAVARVPLRLRRAAARLSGWRWVPLDPVLADRAAEPDRREAWLRDQYRHPEEHRHTLHEVQGWFGENGVEYLRAYPSALIGEDEDALFAPAADNWRLEGWLAQLGWMASLGHEGGLFVTVGRRAR